MEDFKIDDPAEMQVAGSGKIKHPGSFIERTLIPEYGLNVAKTCRLIAANRPHFINVLRGEAPVSREIAYKLGALMRDEVADLLIAWQLNYDLQQERGMRELWKKGIQRLPDPAAAEA